MNEEEKKRGPHPKLGPREDDVIVSLLREMQPLYVIAEMLGCDRHTLLAHIRADEMLMDELDESRARRHDRVEQRIIDGIIKGEWEALELWASNRMKHRGYGKDPAPGPMADNRPVIRFGEPLPEQKS